MGGPYAVWHAFAGSLPFAGECSVMGPPYKHSCSTAAHSEKA